MGEPTIEIVGPKAEKAAHQLQGVLRATFGEEGRRLAPPTVDSSGRKINPTAFAVIAIGASLPEPIDNTPEVATKTKLVSADPRAYDVLFHFLAFKYNGDGWYDVHPLVAEIPEFQRERRGEAR